MEFIMINNVIRGAKQYSLALVIFIVGSTNTYATKVDIAQTPLFLGASVQPNVFFLFCGLRSRYI